MADLQGPYSFSEYYDLSVWTFVCPEITQLSMDVSIYVLSRGT